MNARLSRLAIATVVLTVQLLGAVVAHAARAPVPAAAPGCDMVCCAHGECDCSAAPSDAPSQPPPVAPAPLESQPKFFPVLVGVVPAPVHFGAAIPAPLIGVWVAAGDEGGAKLFRLKCSLLM